MATRKPLVVVAGVARQIADADALSANGGVERGTAGALSLGTDANTTSLALGTNAALTLLNIGTGMGASDVINIGGPAGADSGAAVQVNASLRVEGPSLVFGFAAALPFIGQENSASSGAGEALTVRAQVGGSGGTDNAGGLLQLQGGNAFANAGGAGAAGGGVTVTGGDGATSGAGVGIGGWITLQPGTGTGGSATDGRVHITGAGAYLLLDEVAADPGTAANRGAVYTKDVSGTTQLFYQPNSSGTPVQVTGVAAPQSEALWMSPVDYYTASSTFVLNPGSWTVGSAFSVVRTITITGVRFYWAGATPRTIRCKLRNGAGTLLASVDVAVSGAGIYTGTFGTPQTISTEAGTSPTYKVSCWEISGTEYTRFATTPAVVPNFPFMGSRSLVWRNTNAFAASDANPTGSGAEYYAVEPMIQT